MKNPPKFNFRQAVYLRDWPVFPLFCMQIKWDSSEDTYYYREGDASKWQKEDDLISLEEKRELKEESE